MKDLQKFSKFLGSALTILILVLGMSVSFSSHTILQSASANYSTPTPFNITLCHFNNGKGGTYTIETIDVNSVNDCTGADGHDTHSQDIIPSYTYGSCTYGGKNLSGQGQAILNNGCVVPTVTPTPVLDCDGDTDGSNPNGDDHCILTPTPTPVLDCDGDTDGSNPNGDDASCITPTATPSATPTLTPSPALTVTPTLTQVPTNGGGPGDGLSDGRSSCPQCTQAPSQQSEGTEQAVLGASTFAGTGTFENTVMDIMLVVGMIVVSLGGLSYAKEKNK